MLIISQGDKLSAVWFENDGSIFLPRVSIVLLPDYLRIVMGVGHKLGKGSVPQSSSRIT
jgi:hypothetical protein